MTYGSTEKMSVRRCENFVKKRSKFARNSRFSDEIGELLGTGEQEVGKNNPIRLRK
jgi:hypothetical protein